MQIPPPVRLPKIPSESGVALSLPAALQGTRRASKGLLNFERIYQSPPNVASKSRIEFHRSLSPVATRRTTGELPEQRLIPKSKLPILTPIANERNTHHD